MEKKEDCISDKMIEALADIAHYNCQEDVLFAIKEYIEQYTKNEQDIYIVAFPEFLQKYECNSYPRIIWSMMVLMFGDYGTSPRYGWIEKEKLTDALDFICKICGYIEETYGDELLGE